MAVVYRAQSTQSNNNTNRNTKKRATPRKRSPISALSTWCLKKTAGTVIGKPLNRLLSDSLLGRMVVGFCLSIILGLILDFSFSSLPNPYGYAVFATLCAVAGGAAGGGGGAVVGLFWGWLVGKVLDVTVAQVTYEILGNTVGTMVAWCFAAILGWYVGRIAVWSFQEISIRRPKLNEIFIEVSLSISYALAAVFIYSFSNWITEPISITIPNFPNLTTAWLEFSQWSYPNLSWFFIIPSWGIIIFLLLYWSSEFTMQIFDPIYAHRREDYEDKIERQEHELEEYIRNNYESFTTEMKDSIKRADLKSMAKTLVDSKPHEPQTTGEFVANKWHGLAVPILMLWLFITFCVTGYWILVTGNWLISVIAWIIFMPILLFILYLIFPPSD